MIHFLLLYYEYIYHIYRGSYGHSTLEWLKTLGQSRYTVSDGAAASIAKGPLLLYNYKTL